MLTRTLPRALWKGLQGLGWSSSPPSAVKFASLVPTSRSGSTRGSPKSSPSRSDATGEKIPGHLADCKMTPRRTDRSDPPLRMNRNQAGWLWHRIRGVDASVPPLCPLLSVPHPRVFAPPLWKRTVQWHRGEGDEGDDQRSRNLSRHCQTSSSPMGTSWIAWPRRPRTKRQGIPDHWREARTDWYGQWGLEVNHQWTISDLHPDGLVFHSLTIFLMHFTDLPTIPAFFEDIIIKLIPQRQGRKLWSRKLGEGTEVQTIDSASKKINDDIYTD